MIIIKLPQWKSYLLDLSERIHIFKGINKGIIKFKLLSGEIQVIYNFFKKMGKGGILKEESRAFIYHHFHSLAEQYQGNLTSAEYRIAIKISPIRKLHLEDLFMEIETLKEFGKEVGLTTKEMKGLEEEDLILEILGRVDKSKKYIDEFVDWYDNLPSRYFEEKKEDKRVKEVKKENEFSLEAITDEIDEAGDSLKKLKKVIEKYPEVFGKYKKTLMERDDKKKLEKEMLNYAANYEITINKTDEKENIMKVDKAHKKAIEKALLEAEELVDLKEIIEDEDYEDYFEDFSIKKKDDFDKKKAEIAKVIGIELEDEDDEEEEKPKKVASKKVKVIDDDEDEDEEEDEEDEEEEKPIKKRGRPAKKKIEDEDEDDEDEETPKSKKSKDKESSKKTTKSPESKKSKSVIKDPEDLVEEKLEEWNDLRIGNLKAEAKRLGVKTVPTMKKQEILNKMKKAYLAGAGQDDEDEDEEIELTQSIVKKLLKSKDLEALQKAAKKCKLELNSVEKKSCSKIADALIEFLTGDDEDEDEKPKAKKEKPKKKDSLFAKVKEMVADGIKDKKIIAKLEDEDAGITEKKLKGLIENAKSELEDEEDDD